MKVGVIGCMGNAGQRHVRNLALLGHEVFGYDPRRKNDLLTQEEFWELPPDAVVIATPPADHYASAIEAMSHGAHTLIEKPLATTLQDAQDLVGAARMYGVRLQCGYQLRHHKSLNVLREKMVAHEPPVEYYAFLQDDMRQWPTATYERDLLLEYSHEIDVAHWMTGDFRTLYAQPYDTGAQVTFSAAHGFGQLFLLHGEHMRHVVTTVGDWMFSPEENEQAYKDELTAFLNGGSNSDGLYTQRLLDAVQRSLAGEGWVTL
jgi:predicted dehydrogenase